METLVAIVSGLVTLAGLGFKYLVQSGDVKSLKAQIEAEMARANAAELALTKEREATAERIAHSGRLEDAISEHLWANALLKGAKN